jgi:hypothetical protein
MRSGEAVRMFGMGSYGLCELSASGRHVDRRRVSASAILSPRMKIDLQTLDAAGFRLELPRPRGAADIVEIATARGLAGSYAHDAKHVRLEALRAAQLALASFAWHVGEIVVASSAVTELDEPRIDLHVPRGPGSIRGRLSATHLHNQDLHLELPEAKVAAEIDARDVDVQLAARGHAVTLVASQLAAPRAAVLAGALSVRSTDLVVGALALEHGAHATALQLGDLSAAELAIRLADRGIEVSAASVVAKGLRLVRTAGALELTASHLVVRGLTLRASGVALSLAEVVLEGASLAGGVLHVERLAAPHATLDLELGGTPTASADGVGTPQAAQPASRSLKQASKRPTKKAPLDLSFLDHLQGRVDVDVNVDAKVPYLKRRKATHHFRVSVDGGTLDYKALEGDLSALEDALIDFAVRKGNLVLEVSPPLLSMLRKTLVEWPLDDAGRALAERRRVRLATLAHPKLPAAKTAPEESRADPSFSLDRLDFAPIDVELSLGGPCRLDLRPRGVVHLGLPGRAAVGKLFLRGELHHRAATTARRPTELLVTASKLQLALEGLGVGSRSLDLATLAIERVDEARIVARGLSPTRATATLVDVVIRGLRLTP